MKKTKYIVMATLISAMLALGSVPVLAMGGYGSIVPSSEVAQAFDKSQADTNLNYYFSGSDVSPNAIIGVNKAYTLDSTLWKKCDSSAIFNKHLAGMKFKAFQGSISLYGFAIQDEMGMNIGVWYSPLNTPTFVRRVSEKAVDIHTPHAQNSLNGIVNGN